MANLYESMNKYFESKYGDDLDNVKKVEKKSLNESKQKLGARKAIQEGIKSRKAMKEARGRTSGKFTVQKALLDAHLDLPRDLSPESQKTAVKKALDVLKTARAAAETDAEKKQYDNAINILTNRPTPVAFNSLGAWYSGISMSEQMSRKNRRKVESLKSAPKRHKLGESKVIISRKAMKEDLGEDIARYQRYVDYDMKHYGKISKKTQDLIDKAGLQVIKDQYGDYEVTAGHYEEACRSRKSMGLKKKSEITEAKEEKDLWDIIYGELTEDGSQYIVPETGKPRINKGAGYKFDSQIAVDRDGNIVVKAKEERDLKAAIDIADKHKDNGVTYNIDQSKYDKNYPYWMTIEIPEEYKECFKESKLTEKHWEYSVNNSVSREFRDAIQSDDEDYERVRRAIIAVYDDIHENAPELLDDDDYEDWVTEEAEVVDLDDEDDVNYLLTNLYDFCDNANIWIGI